MGQPICLCRNDIICRRCRSGRASYAFSLENNITESRILDGRMTIVSGGKRARTTAISRHGFNGLLGMSKTPHQRLQEFGDEFSLMVGNCISQWAHVQDELFDICWRCLGCPKEKASIVYFRTPTIEARMTLVDDLVHSVLPKRVKKSGGHDHDDLKLWKDIVTDFKDLLQPRNQIAHHPVFFRSPLFPGPNAGSPPKDETESWFEIYVSQNERLRKRSKAYKPMLVSDLRDHLIAVNLIIDRLSRFLYQILRQYVPASFRQGARSSP
jgi:hypothetical protein